MKNTSILFLLAIIIIFIKKKCHVKADIQIDPLFFKKCPSGQYINKEYSCEKCNVSCKECSYSQYYKNNHICTICANNYYYDLVRSECVQNCSKGMRTNQQDKTCEKCEILNCSSCEQSVKTCSSCVDNYLLTEQQCIYQGEEDLLFEQKLLSLIGEEQVCSIKLSNSSEQYQSSYNTKDLFRTEDTNICPIIKNELNNNEHLKYIYSLVDEQNSRIYLFSMYKIQLYNMKGLQLMIEGRNVFPNNSIDTCGFLEFDSYFFYCIYDNYQVVKYNNITFSSEIIFKIEGQVKVLNDNFYSKTLWKYGRILGISNNKNDTLEIYQLDKKIKNLIQLPPGQEYYFFESNEQIFYYVKDKQQLYLLNLNKNEHLIVKDQIENLISILAIKDDNYYLFSKYTSYYCNWPKTDLQTKVDLQKNCQPLQDVFSSNESKFEQLAFFSNLRRSEQVFYSKEKVLIAFNAYYSSIYVLDIQDDWSKIRLSDFQNQNLGVFQFYFSDSDLYFIKNSGETVLFQMIAQPLEQNKKIKHNIFNPNQYDRSKCLWNFSGLQLHRIILKIPQLIAINENEVLMINLLPSSSIDTKTNKNDNKSLTNSDIFQRFLKNNIYEISDQLGYTNALDQNKVVGSQAIQIDFINPSEKNKIQYELVLIIENFALRSIIFQGNNNFQQMMVRINEQDGPILANSYVKQFKIIILWFKSSFQIFEAEKFTQKYFSDPIYKDLNQKSFPDYKIEQSSDQKTLGILMINKSQQQALFHVLDVEQKINSNSNYPNIFKKFLEYSYISTGNNMIIAIYQNNTHAFVYNLLTRKYQEIKLETNLNEHRATISLTTSNIAAISYQSTKFNIQMLDGTNTTKSIPLQQKATLQYFFLYKRTNNKNVLIIFTDTEIVAYELQNTDLLTLNNTLNYTKPIEPQRLACPGKKELINTYDENLQTNENNESEMFLYVKSDGQLICIVNIKEKQPYPMKKIYSKVYVYGINILRRNESTSQNYSIQKEDILAIKGMSTILLYERRNETDDYKLYFESQTSCREVSFSNSNLICENTGVRETSVLPTSKSSLLNKILMDTGEKENSVNYDLSYYTYLASKQMIIMKAANKLFKAVKLNTKEQIEFLKFPNITNSTNSINTTNVEELTNFEEDDDSMFGYYYDELSNVFLSVSKNSVLQTYEVTSEGTIGKRLNSISRTQMVFLGIVQKKRIILYWIPSSTSLLFYEYIQGKELKEEKLEIDKTQADKLLKLFDFNDDFLYILIARILYKFSFKEPYLLQQLINFQISNDELTWFSSIYCAQYNYGVFLINQMDIFIVNSNTLEIEKRRFQNEPEYFLPTFSRQLNLITLIPSSSSKIYYLFFPNNNAKASEIQVYETEFHYSLYTRYIDLTNQIMCVLTVDSVIHFIDLKPMTENSFKQTSTNSQNNSGDSLNNQNGSSDTSQEIMTYSECLSFSLHDLLEDLVNSSNGLDNSIRIYLQMIYNQDIFIIGYYKNLYIYSISKKQSLFIARSHEQPIFRVSVINDQILLSGDSTGVYMWSIEEMIKYKALHADLRGIQNLVFQSNFKENKDSFAFYYQDKSQLFLVDKENAEILKRIQIQQNNNDKTYYVNNSWQKNKKKYNTAQNNTQNEQDDYILFIYLRNQFLLFNDNLTLAYTMEFQVEFKQLLGFYNNFIIFTTTQNNLYVTNIQNKTEPIVELKYNYQVVQNFQQKNNFYKIDVYDQKENKQDDLNDDDADVDDFNEIFLILENGSIFVINCKVDPFLLKKNFYDEFKMQLQHETIQSMQITKQHIVLLNSQSEIILLRYVSRTENALPDLSIVRVFKLPQIQFSGMEFDFDNKRLFLLSSVDDAIYSLNYLPFISFDPKIETETNKQKFQPNQLFLKTPMQLLSTKSNKFLINQDYQYYIVYSRFLINIYYAQDYKLKVQINQIFYQSKIQQVRIINDNILFVSTQSEIVLFIMHSSNPSYSVSHSICFSSPYLYHYNSQRLGVTSPFLSLQLYLNSHSGFTKLDLQIDLSQINKQQRLKNIFSAISPQKSCITQDLYTLRQQIKSSSSLSDSSKTDLSKLQSIYDSQYKAYDCVLSFDLNYSSINQRYISSLFYSLQEINYKSLQLHQPRTVKIKVPKSENPQTLDLSLSAGSFIKNNQILFYSECQEESIILLNQNSTFGSISGQSLFLYNIAFYFDTKTEKPSQSENKSRILQKLDIQDFNTVLQTFDKNDSTLNQYMQSTFKNNSINQQQKQFQIFEDSNLRNDILLNENYFIDNHQYDNLKIKENTSRRQLQTSNQLLAQSQQNKIIGVYNRYRFSLKSIKFLNSNNEYTFKFQNITRQFTDQIDFENISFVFSSDSNQDKNQQQNKSYYDNYNYLSYNRTQCLMQFSELQSLKASNILFKNIQCGQSEPFLFHFEKVQKMVFSNITIEEINTKHLRMFSFREINELLIQNITVRNVNVETFNLFTFQNIQKLTIINVTVENLTQMITQRINISYLIQLFGVINTQISDFIIQNAHNTLFIFANELMLQQNEITMRNKNFILNNLLILDSTYNTLTIEDKNIDKFQNSPFLKIESKSLTFTNSNITYIQTGNQLFYFKTENTTCKNITITQIYHVSNQIYKQSEIEAKSQLNLININLIENINICIRIVNTKKISIENFNIINNRIFLDRSYTSTTNQPLLQIQGGDIVSVTKLFLIENYSQDTVYSFILLLDVQTFKIMQSNFSSNYACSAAGGAMSIINEEYEGEFDNIDVSFIIQSFFLNNSAPLNAGGALYLKEVNLNINQTCFENNYAQIGGAIKLSYRNDLPIFYKKYLDKNYQIDFLNNTSLFYGDNIGFYPSKIQISKHGSDYVNDTLIINNFRSGDKISDIKISLLDYEGNQVYLRGNQTSSNEIIDQYDQEYQFQIDSLNKQIFISDVQTTKNLQSFIVNITAVSEPLTVQTITIEQYLPLYPRIEKNESGKYELRYDGMKSRFIIQARSCQQGEVYQQTMGISTCIPCPEGKYSFEIPDANDKQKAVCKICPPYALNCMKNKIELKNGYWRENDQSDDVYECEQNFLNCNNEDPKSKYHCSEGYVGPLCSSCDIEGKVWANRYSKVSQTICKRCTFYGIQAFLLSIFLFVSVFYLIFLINQNQICTTKKIQAQYLKIMGIIRFGKSAQFQRNSILSKMLMHYVQILLIIMNSYKVKIPNFFDALQVSGDPIMNIYFSLDCFLAETGYQIVLLRILWTLFFVFFLVCIGFIYFLYHYFKDKSQQKTLSNYISFFSMSVKVVLMYVFPGLLSQLSKVLTCVQIGSKKYSLADLQYHCSDRNYQILAYYFVLPIFCMMVFVIPAILIYRIRRIVQRPSVIRLQKSFGFLFYDYKTNAYYWEILKLQLKAFIIVSSTLLHSYVMNSLLITLVMLMIYIFFLLKVKPYKILDFNTLDFLAHLINCFTIVFILISLSTVFQILKYVCFCIIIFLNSFFVLKIFIVYFSGIIISRNSESRTYFQKFFFLLKKVFPKLFQCIKLQKDNSFKILLLWHKLSQHLNEKRDLFNQVSQSQLSKILNQDQSLKIKAESYKEYDEEDESQIKKLNNQESNQWESNQASQLIFNRSKTQLNIINQSNNTSQIELSVQEHKEFNKPKYQLSLKNQISQLNNMPNHFLSLDSPTQFSQFKFHVQQNKNSDSDSETHNPESKIINLISTNTNSHAVVEGKVQNVGVISGSMQSCSNFLSQKSLERQSSKQLLSPTQQKKSYIQKAILINRMKDKEFSVKSPVKRESLKTQNLQNQTLRKVQTLKNSKTQFSSNNLFFNFNQSDLNPNQSSNQSLNLLQLKYQNHSQMHTQASCQSLQQQSSSQNQCQGQTQPQNESITMISEIISPLSFNTTGNKLIFPLLVHNGVSKKQKSNQQQVIDESDNESKILEKQQEQSQSYSNNSAQSSNKLENICQLQKSTFQTRNLPKELLELEEDNHQTTENDNQKMTESIGSQNDNQSQSQNNQSSPSLKKFRQPGKSVNVPKSSKKVVSITQIKQFQQDLNSNSS